MSDLVPSAGHHIIIKGQTPGMEMQAEDGGWMSVPVTLPDGYRIVATVDRDDGSIWDLGQNNDKEFRLFQRSVAMAFAWAGDQAVTAGHSGIRADRRSAVLSGRR